ncbi:MAG: hypothetical protein R3B55_02680 [Candidatus Paceibacterota bacterium]
MEILKMIKNVFIVLLALGIAFILLGYVKEKIKSHRKYTRRRADRITRSFLCG